MSVHFGDLDLILKVTAASKSKYLLDAISPEPLAGFHLDLQGYLLRGMSRHE